MLRVARRCTDNGFEMQEGGEMKITPAACFDRYTRTRTCTHTHICTHTHTHVDVMQSMNYA